MLFLSAIVMVRSVSPGGVCDSGAPGSQVASKVVRVAVLLATTKRAGARDSVCLALRLNASESD